MYRQLLFLLLLLPAAAPAQQRMRAQAYLVLPGGDTLRGRTVLLPEDYRFQSRYDGFGSSGLDVLSDSGIVHYTARELKAFGVRQRLLEAHYRSLQPSPDARPFFARVLVMGPRITLYPVSPWIVRWKPPVASQLPPPDRAAHWSFAGMLLQDRQGRFLLLSYVQTRKQLQRELRRFFEGQPDLLALVERSIDSFNDVQVLAEEANRL
ncbi:hypothetical protein [Flaviaesturariibacter terrae]